MSRPPRNGFTVNSDTELSLINTSFIPNYTPILNLDRKCWGIHIENSPEINPLWTPANITTQLWLDAADSSTITLDGGAVSQWGDKSGNGRNATQTTAANRPVVLSANINGLNVLSFDNSNDAMTTGWNLSATNNYMIFMVANQVQTGDRRVINSTTYNNQISNSRLGGQYVQIKDDVVVSTNWSVSGTTNQSVLVAPPSGNFSYFGNGTSITTNARSVTDWGVLTFGALGTYNEPLDGRLCEVIVVYSSDTTTRQLIEGYLAHKWGLVVYLPNDHPYKSLAPTLNDSSSEEENPLPSLLKVQYIPQNAVNAYGLTSINISSSPYILDLSTTSQYIRINLNTNTELNLINASKYTEYIIELIPNGNIIKNFTDVFTTPKQYNLSSLLTYYFGRKVVSVQYIDKLYCDFEYTDNVYKSGLLAKEEKINWVRPELEILYFPLASSVLSYTGSGISGASITVGNPVIEKSRLLLGQTGRIEATKTNLFDFNEVDFTISFFCTKNTLEDFGCILGSHRSSSSGFYLGVSETNQLSAVFGANSLTCDFPEDLKEHSIIINRIGKVYKIFIDGILVSHKKADNNFNNRSSEPLCIGSLKNSVGTPSWTSQSWQGYLRQITINKSASIPFSVKDVPPKDLFASTTVLLLKFNVGESDLAQYSLTRSFTSNTTTYPLVTSERLSKYSHIAYSNSNLELSGDVTLEAKIFNPATNTRGAIIDVEGGFTWGIYDLKLRITFGSFTLDGLTDIPDSKLVDVAFVKSGTTCSLFLNGELEATATTGEAMNVNSSASEFSIKRTYTQDSAVASLNTSLFRSRSWIEIAQLRVTKSARYNTNYIPDFSYGSSY